MGMIDFPCPSCGRILKVSTEHIGQRGTCKHCGEQITIQAAPSPDAAGDSQARALEALARKPRSLEELVEGVFRFLAASLGWDLHDKAVLFLMHEEAGGLRLAKTRGQFSEDFLKDEAFVPLGSCLCGRAAETGQVLMCGDCFDDPRHDRRWLGMQTHGHYVIPLTHAGRVLGVLTLYTRAGIQADDGRMALLQKVGRQAGKELQHLLQTKRASA